MFHNPVSTIPRCFVGFLTAAMMPLCVASAEETAPAKPNVVFIAIEDFNPEHLGAYGGAAKSPNIDRLASQGVLFENAYVQAPVCNPSRTALFTGLRPPTSGVFGNRDNYKKMVIPDLPVTMPQQFKRNGYETVHVGKMMHKRWDGGHAASWTRKLPNRISGRKKLSAWTGSVIDTLDELEGADEGGWFASNLQWGAVDCEPEEFRDGHSAASATNFLAQKHESPFFLGIGFSAPHVKFAAPKRFFDLYELSEIEIPNNPADDLADMPGVNSKNSIHEGLDAQKWQEIKRAQFACISYVDWCVGQVMDAIKENNLDRNTIVVLWTDHGFALGEHFQWGKGGMLIEETNKVAMIWKAPGLTPRGARSTSIVESIDIFPTLFDLADIPTPSHVQGQSMVEVLKDPRTPLKKAAFTWSGPERVSIQTGRYRLNVDRDLDPASFALYDHKYDPGEYVNVSSNPQYVDVIDRLIGYYKHYQQKYSISETHENK
jgi:uncharacterized sulfatase